MNKVRIAIICIVVATVLCVAGYFIYNKFSYEPPIDIESGDLEPVNESLAEKATITTITIKENATGENRFIDVKYPSIQSFKNKDFQNYVNNSITSVILAYKDEIMVMIDEETPDTALYTYKTSYDKYANGDYLSLVISNDYQTGGIRSNQWKDIYNINMRTERIFYLADIFPANIDFEEEILYQIERQAEFRKYDLMNGAGLKELDDKQKFYIDNGKLIIYFDPAEIAPATYGALQFEMPFKLGENGLFEI